MTAIKGFKKKKKLLYGWGVSDADYITVQQIDGKPVWCPIYQKWCSMVTRAFSKATQRRYPSYLETTVNEEWKHFTDFSKWMKTQMWEGLHLDKDILIPGNKEYGSKTCAFVPTWVNTLFVRTSKSYNDQPLGVTFVAKYGKFVACCSNISESSTHRGNFDDSMEAHRAWQLAKIKSILIVVEKYRLQEYYRLDVENALLFRVDQLQNDYDSKVETKSLV